MNNPEDFFIDVAPGGGGATNPTADSPSTNSPAVNTQDPVLILRMIPSVPFMKICFILK